MSESIIFLAKSQNHKNVWYDAKHSHAATHIADTPGLKALAAEVIERSELVGDHMKFHMDLARIIGQTDLVENEPGDELIYAKRLNRQEYTAFNKSRGPAPCSAVTVVVERQPDDNYELLSTWIGSSDVPNFPGTENETPESRTFWAQHALAWGRQDIQPGTETSVCPW